MTITVTQIGKMKGIQLPDEILKKCNISDSVELEIVGASIVLKSVKDNPRKGWNEAFQEMSSKKDDKLLIDDSLNLQPFVWEW